MIRLEVITSDTQPTDIIKNTTNNILELADYYRNALAEASANRTELLHFEGIEFAEKRSANFQNIGILEKCIMDFLYENEFPKKVCIVCDSDDKTELYKVVYNYYYPMMEDEKLDDERWN